LNPFDSKMGKGIVEPLGGYAKRKCCCSNGICSWHLIILLVQDNTKWRDFARTFAGFNYIAPDGRLYFPGIPCADSCSLSFLFFLSRLHQSLLARRPTRWGLVVARRFRSQNSVTPRRLVITASS